MLKKMQYLNMEISFQITWKKDCLTTGAKYVDRLLVQHIDFNFNNIPFQDSDVVQIFAYIGWNFNH